MNYYDDQMTNLDILITALQHVPGCMCADYGAADCLCGRREAKEQIDSVPIDTLRQWLREALQRSGLKINFSSQLRRHTLGQLVIPYGKYSGKRFDEIPLSYLDETISVMPTTWIVSMAKEYVHVCIGIIVNGSSGRVKAVPRHSWSSILDGSAGDLSSYTGSFPPESEYMDFVQPAGPQRRAKERRVTGAWTVYRR